MSPDPGDPTDSWAGAGVDAWSLTARISPRRVVRAAAVDANGQPLNAYPLVHPVAGARPGTPWAVFLADAEGRYRLLCADLDAKLSAEAAAADAARLAHLLSELGIPHLVCASGLTGGRHVWIGLLESVDAEGVHALVYLLKAWLPTLDVAPLVNPSSGCVRPPGSPHRLGGISQVIRGSVTALTDPRVTVEQVNTLMSTLSDLVKPSAAASGPRRQRPVAEASGVPFLPGPKRELSAPCQRLLDASPTGDLSAVLWRVLCGAAAARWRFADIASIADAPGLEHARTVRAGATRVPRPVRGPESPMGVLRRQWARAVHAVAELVPSQPAESTDVSFDLRAELVTAMVRTVQRSADATSGRWGRSRAGLAQRRILDTLCLFHLQAVRDDEVEADIRRLALTCGLDRETARRSLLALAADGWISRTQHAAGRRGARWTIDPGGGVHTRVTETLSQADPRPAGTGPALRAALMNELVDRLHANAHDAFATKGGLGLEAGSLYGRLSEPLDSVQCSQLLGWSIEKTTCELARLGAAGLLEWRGRCWQRASDEKLDRVAVDLGTDGSGHRRADLYAVERALWAWWREELDAMRLAHRRPGYHRVRQGISWPLHPRCRDGRADFVAARRALRQSSRVPIGLMSLRGTPKTSPFSRLTFKVLSPQERAQQNRTRVPLDESPPARANEVVQEFLARGVRQEPSSSLLVGEGEDPW